MRKLQFLTAVTVFIAQAAAAAPAYKVIAVPNRSVPTVSVNVTFRVGSADDPKGLEGLAELTAELLREGGVKKWKSEPERTRSEMEKFLFPKASEIELWVSKEQTSFAFTASVAEAESVLKLLAQMLLAPKMDGGEFDRLKDDALVSVQKQLPLEDQEEFGKAVLDRAIYGKDHPYGHPTAGTVAGVKKIDRAKIEDFYTKLYTQKRLSIAIAGAYTSNFESMARTLFGDLPEGNATHAEIPKVELPEKARLILVKGPFEATGVNYGHVLDFTRASKDFPVMDLASQAFGKHRSFVGRLMNVVRKERALNYGSYSYIEDFPMGGRLLAEPTQAARTQQTFTVWGRPTTLENGCFLTRQLYYETDKLVRSGLSAEEFSLVKSHLVGATPLLATSLDRQLGYKIDSDFYGIQGDYLKILQNGIRAATPAQVSALLKKNIHPSKLTMVVVTPDPEKLKAELLSPKCSIHYAEGSSKSPAILAEDRKIESTKLPVSADQIEIWDGPKVFEE